MTEKDSHHCPDAEGDSSLGKRDEVISIPPSTVLPKVLPNEAEVFLRLMGIHVSNGKKTQAPAKEDQE